MTSVKIGDGLSVYFFDTSALLKRYIQEPGTNWVRQLTLQSQGHMLVVSQIVSVETVSALARRQREQRITTRQMRAAMLLLERHLRREYTIIPFSNEVEQLAKSLLVTHPLRGLIQFNWRVPSLLIGRC